MDLTPLFAPRSIAVVGASNDPSRLGGSVLHHLLTGFDGQGYEGPIAPVNSSRTEVQGLSARSSVAELDFIPDLVVVVSRATTVLEVARESVARGARAMIVISSGFSETGDVGESLQAELAHIASAAGIPLLGPNCLGLVNVPGNLRASFARFIDLPSKPGPVAVVSQSGAVGLAIYEQAQISGLGASFLCMTGNEAGVGCADLIEYVAGLDEVNVVLTYLEGVKDPDRLMEASMYALERGKPVIALKAGRSVMGSEAAVSHTGAMVIPDSVIDSALSRVGVVRAASIRQMLDYARVLAPGRRRGGRRTVVVTGSGGTGVMMADAAELFGLDLPRPSTRLSAVLSELVPPIGSIANPIDLTAQVVNEPHNFDRLVREVATSPEFDTLVMGQVSRTQLPGIVDLMAELSAEAPVPIVVQSHFPEIVSAMTLRGVPAVDDALAAMDMVAVCARYSERREDVLSEDRKSVLFPRQGRQAPAGRVLTSRASRELLERRGIRFAADETVFDAKGALDAWSRIGGPVALKVDAAWMPHKSEHGGLVLGCATQEEVRAGFDQIAALAERSAPGMTTPVIVQEMIIGGIEVLCGGFRDVSFGPVVTVGIGGTLVEIVKEQRLALAPVSRNEASRLVRELAGGRLLGMDRGLSTEAGRALAEAVMAISDVLIDDPDVIEVEINPLIAQRDDLIAVDALISRGEMEHRGVIVRGQLTNKQAKGRQI